MIRHIVLLDVDADGHAERLRQVMQGLGDLAGQMSGFTAFTHGPNADYEAKSQRYSYGFVCTFADEAALQCYATDSRHQALGAELVAMCRGGADGIFVADLVEGAS